MPNSSDVTIPLPKKKKGVINKPEKREKIKYLCMCCGTEKGEEEFYRVPSSRMWNASDKKILFCKDCIETFIKETSNSYGERTAYVLACALVDIPFIPESYNSLVDGGAAHSFGIYRRYLNVPQFKDKTFAYTVTAGILSKDADEIKAEKEVKWSNDDNRNMNYSISMAGYDPFDDINMTSSDRKYCFNTLASYLDTSGVVGDGHKIQSVIQLTQLQLQCRKIDEMLNMELLKTTPDEDRIKNLTTTKGALLKSVSDLARDNNISSNFSKDPTAGKESAGTKMKQIAEAGLEAIKVNAFDVKTCDAMQQVANISMKSILEEAGFGDNDVAEMLKMARELNVSLQEKSDALQEENRLLKNELTSIKAKKGGGA